MNYLMVIDSARSDRQCLNEFPYFNLCTGISIVKYAYRSNPPPYQKESLAFNFNLHHSLQ